MQTVQFQCGHCGKLMGVGSEHLGQQVRCPHCQQIVVAPLPTAAPPPGLTETFLHEPSPRAEHEDIFSPPEASDDLFGRSEAPRIEMPPEPFVPTPFGDPAVSPLAEPAASSTMPYVPPESVVPQMPFAPFGGDSIAVQPSASIPSWMEGSAAESVAPTAAEAPTPTSEPSTAAARTQRRTEAKTPWFILLVFSPLLLYAIVITVFAALLYQQEQDLEKQLRNPFEMMPDEGDKPGVQKAKQISLWNYDRKMPTLPLPGSQCTSLAKHEPLRIGDLQVTPKRVERKRVRVIVGNTNPEPCSGDSLVLYLDVKNLSSEYAFAPLDNYFDRSWRSGARPPLTLLEAGDGHRFYGGPADWYPRGDREHARARIEGRKDSPEVLQPGEEKEMFVCTDGSDPKAVSFLFGEGRKPPYHGSFLWRVRVRRGLARVRDKDYPCTAVIGVRFRDSDIGENQPPAQ